MFQNDNGYLEAELSLEKDKFVKIEGATAKLKTETKFSNKLNLGTEIEIIEEKSIAFYLRFLANDNDTFNSGDYENVFSGCMKELKKTTNML